ncbi:hypothetical protein FHR21_003831 [Sphingopyxis panaciterrulae]|uniref:Transglycosylase SLT domain-containing protein n=1 Tax=Sphingopyxis panaciterrulae TaxID=462372 RepID=A0A7W9B911_9SPHN|nr:hypothetical protein [Sphingopyxis panaciterrulae]
MRVESGGRTMLDGRPITSRAGAIGLMQLMPGTWADPALSRLVWIEREGLSVSFDLEAERAALRKIVPGWTLEDAEDEIYRSTSRGGWVATDTEPGDLEDVPIDDLLDASDALSGRTRDILVEKRPFKGVSERWPVRALASLVRSAGEGGTREREWSDFLWHDARSQDPTRFRILIAERLSSLSQPIFGANLQAVAAWLSRAGSALSHVARGSYLKIWERVVETAIAMPDVARSSIVSDTEGIG